MILDPGPAQVELSVAEGWELPALDYTPPQTEMLAVGSVSTEGELSAGSKVGNRTVSATVECVGSGATREVRHADMRTKLSVLEQKVGKLAREGGVWRRVLSDGSTIDFYIRRFNQTGLSTDHKFVFGNVGEITLEALCAPYGVGVEEEIAVELEHAGPVVVTQPFSVGGSAPALGRVLLTAPTDQTWVRGGIEFRSLSDAPTAGGYYRAEDLTPLGSASVVSNVVRQTTLSPDWLAMLSTEIAGVGHMTQVGIFEVWAKVKIFGAFTDNGGDLALRLGWGAGDGAKWIENDPIRFAAGHIFAQEHLLLNLGEVRLSPTARGTHFWEGLVSAQSTVRTDGIEIVDLAFVPVGERNFEIRSRSVLEGPAPTQFPARDEFDQSSGDLNGKTAPAGGNWVTGGPTGDFTVNTATKAARRTVLDDAAGLPRVAALPVLLTDTIVSVDVTDIDGFGEAWSSVVARLADVDNLIELHLVGTNGELYVRKRIGGTQSNVAQLAGGVVPASADGSTRTLTLIVLASGLFIGMVDGVVYLVGVDADFATGGPLASGYSGFSDLAAGGLANTRDYDNFKAWAPTLDAAIFAGRGLEIANDHVEREAQTGGTWSSVAEHRTDFAYFEPSGVEDRQNRLVIATARHPPGLPVVGTDDKVVQVFATPRYLAVPDVS